MTLPYWFFTRPQRKLYRVPQSVAALREVAYGRPWSGSRELHIAFEEVLERESIKRQGDRRDAGGSGGRTHASLLRSLGLAFEREADERMYLTLAGEALADGEPPAPILGNQVLKYQFPSPYSVGRNVDVDRRFQLRPMVLLLRLLLDDRVGYLAQEEIALRVITLGDRHTVAGRDKVVEAILQYREDGDSSLEPDFSTRFCSNRGRPDRLREALADIANTAMNWMQHTNLVERQDDQIWITPGRETLAQELIEQHGGAALIPDPQNEEKFQRRYGLPPGRSKDTRNLSGSRALSREEAIDLRVQTVVLGIARTEMIVAVPPAELLERVSASTGFSPASVSAALGRVMPDRSRTLDQFLLGYAEMARSSRERARDFELATTDVFKRVFELDARHVGGAGREPDVVVDNNNFWRIIVDTKAHGNGYTLPASDERAMKEYVAAYAQKSPKLRAWVFISSSFGASINPRLRKIVDETGVPGSAVGITAWIALIQHAQDGRVDAEMLLALLSVGREVTLEDVQRVVVG